MAKQNQFEQEDWSNAETVDQVISKQVTLYVFSNKKIFKKALTQESFTESQLNMSYTPPYHSTMIQIDQNNILITGGTYNGCSDVTQIDISDNSVHVKAPMNIKRMWHSMVKHGHNVYVIGGFN